MFRCPCCNSLTLTENDEICVDICPVCYWQYDRVGQDYSNEAIGPNRVSFNQAKVNYITFGASEERFVKFVRKPTEEEIYGYSRIDNKTHMLLWDRIVGDYHFSANYTTNTYPWISIAGIYKTFSLPEKVWSKEQELLINSFFIKLNCSRLYALDWQHDGFEYSPENYSKLIKEYHDDKRNCNVYFPCFYPNGDYHFFVDPSFEIGIWGHPWMKKIVVIGKELIIAFEMYSKQLNLTIDDCS